MVSKKDRKERRNRGNCRGRKWADKKEKDYWKLKKDNLDCECTHTVWIIDAEGDKCMKCLNCGALYYDVEGGE